MSIAWPIRAVLIAAIAAVGMAGCGGSDGRSPAPAAAASTPQQQGSYADGYRAGREDAFSGFDGGWAFDEPYIVILRRGGDGITYRIARRWPVLAGREYRSCRPQFICSRRLRTH